MMAYLHLSVPLGQVSQNSLSVAVDNGTASNSSNKFQVNYQKFTEPLLFPQSLRLSGSVFNVFVFLSFG